MEKWRRLRIKQAVIGVLVGGVLGFFLTPMLINQLTQSSLTLEEQLLFDPIAEDERFIAPWQPSTVSEMKNAHPMGERIAIDWQSSHLQNSEFLDLPIRPFAVDDLERYFLIYTIQSTNLTIASIVERYGAATMRDDPTVLLWPADFSSVKVIAIILAHAIHHVDYNRQVLQVGDRILLLVPNIRYLGMDKTAAF